MWKLQFFILSLFLTLVTACHHSTTVVDGDFSKDTAANSIQSNIEEETIPKLLKKKTVYRVKSDTDKLVSKQIVLSERYDSTGNKTDQFEKHDTLAHTYFYWTYNPGKGFKRGMGEGADRHVIRKECKFTYDSNGKEIENNIYHFSGWLSLFENKYNSDGSIAEKCEFRHYKLVRKNTYKYDSNGKEIEECCYNKYLKLDYKKTYSYDNEGKLSEMDVYNRSGNLEYKTIYYYDAKDNCVKYCNYSGKDGCLEGIFVVKYDYY